MRKVSKSRAIRVFSLIELGEFTAAERVCRKHNRLYYCRKIGNDLKLFRRHPDTGKSELVCKRTKTKDLLACVKRVLNVAKIHVDKRVESWKNGSEHRVND